MARINRNLPKFKSRVRRKAGREFGQRFLANLGVGQGFGGMGRSRSIGGLSIPGSSYSQPGSADTPLNFSPDVADRVTNSSNATVSTILNQLNTLIKLADKIGIVTKDQQRSMLTQIAAARRMSREQQRAIPEAAQSNTSNSLAVVDRTISDLIKQFEALTGTVNEKIRESEDGDEYSFFERFLGNLGIDVDDYRSQRKAKQAAKAGKTGVTPDLTPEAPSNKPTATAKPAISQPMQQVTKNTSQSVSKIAQTAAAGSGGVKDAIKRAAAPLVGKSLGKMAMRSIPILGIGAGAIGAVSRLLEGDAVGAGLDLASGAFGLVTAIPLITASIVRDVYSSVYGIQPESDPQFKERVVVVEDTVKEIVKDTLGQKVDPKSPPTGDEVKKALLPDKMPKTEADAKRMAAPTPAVTTPPPAKTSPPPAATSSPPPAATSSPSPAKPPAAPSGSGGGKSGGSSGSATKPEPTAAPTSGTMEPPKPTNTGAEIMNASTPPAAPAVSGLGYNSDLGRFMPQMTSTPAAGRAGIGDVPNPDYIPSGDNNLGKLYDIMFFNVNYQRQ